MPARLARHRGKSRPLSASIVMAFSTMWIVDVGDNIAWATLRA
jgi:hypothetical protein